jgi:membrane-associated phospholipid phosphatase
MNIYDLISLSTAFLYAIPIIGYTLSGNILHIKAFVGLFVTMGLGESIKYFVIKEASPRPKAARDCNLWCNDGPQGGKPGMPSGHSSQAAFFASFYYHQTKNVWIRTGLIMYELLVILSRYQKHCHTIPQIAAGTLFGLFMSWCVR